MPLATVRPAGFGPAGIGRGNGGFRVLPGAAGSWRRGHDPRDFERGGEAERYDAVLATVPNDIFVRLMDERLIEDIGDGYVRRLHSIQYQTALCLLLELDRRFSPFYWTNVADRELPFGECGFCAELIGPQRIRVIGNRFATLDTKTAQVCANVKADKDGAANDEDIIVYTLTFGNLPTSAETLMQNCASGTNRCRTTSPAPVTYSTRSVRKTSAGESTT